MKIEQVQAIGVNGSTTTVGHFSSSHTTVLQLGKLELDSDEKYTLHGYVKASRASTMVFESKSADVGTSWSEFAFTFNADSNGLQITFSPAEYWLSNWKLEKGDIITPWTPSPIDSKEDLIEQKSEWTQTAAGIRSDVSALSKNLENANSSWQQTATSIRQEVSKKADDEEIRTLVKQETGDLSLEIAKKTTSGEVLTMIEASVDDIRLSTGTLTWEAKNSSLKEDGTFSCKNGNFDGDITAKSITLGDGQQCKLLWGEAVPTYAWGGMASLGYYGGAGGAVHSLDIDAGGIALGSGTLSDDGQTVVPNSEALMGVQGTGTAFITAPNGFYVNGEEYKLPVQASNNYLFKDGYTCHLHCWGVIATEVVQDLDERYRPKGKSISVSGWCRNRNGQMYYPCIGMINTSGQWQLYAMTSFGGSAYAIYEPGNRDDRYSFDLLLTGSWVTAYNG